MGQLQLVDSLLVLDQGLVVVEQLSIVLLELCDLLIERCCVALLGSHLLLHITEASANVISEQPHKFEQFSDVRHHFRVPHRLR